MRQGFVAISLAALMAAPAGAEPVAGSVAKGLLFPADAAQVQIVKGSPLSEQEATLLATVVAGQPYFGAIAISPDEKLLESKATIAVASFHTPEAASAEALRQCDALRQGKSRCVIAAVIRPKGWEKRALSLSSEATAGFVKSYPATAGAMAISSSSAAWSITKGQGAAEAALKSCGAKAKDCRLVVVD